MARARARKRSLTLVSALRGAFGVHFGERIDQTGFYNLCADEEARLSKGLRRNFKDRQDSNRRHMSKLEKQPISQQTLLFLQIVTTVLKLPKDFLLEFGDATVEAAVAAAEAHWDNEAGRLADRALSQAASSEMLREYYDGFRRIGADELLPASREAAEARLDELASANGAGERGIALIEGRTGVGKSFLISRWFWSTGRSVFRQALLLDCASLSIDQVLPAATAFFETAGGTSARGRLLALDGWRVERQDGAALLSTPKSERRVQEAELVAVINNLFDQIPGLAVILAVENNGEPLRESSIVTALDPRALYWSAQVRPLSRDQSIEFLSVNGLRLNEGDLGRIAQQCHGLPLALSVAAEDLKLRSADELEDYLIETAIQPLQPGSEFVTFFKKWLARQDARDAPELEPVRDTLADPHALLRLLAIMSGPVSQAEIAEIITAANVERLFGRRLTALERGEVPFVVRSTRGFDLHAMIRAHLRSELNLFIESDNFGRHTSRAELERIHWRAALIKLRALGETRQGDADAVSSLEAFVYHLLEQARLIPTTAEGRNRRRKKRSSGINSELLLQFRRAPGQLSNAHLWELAYHEVKRFLLEGGHVTTRVFGQFEAKARILRRLLRSAEEQEIKLQADLAELLRKEYALSLMHAGRLRLAQRGFGSTLTLPQPTGHTRQDDADWARICDLASVELTIRLRSGEGTETLTDALAPFLRRAKSIAQDALTETHAERGDLSPKQRAALRMLSRAADITLHAGDLPRSLELFELASNLHRWGRRYELDGECARRYAIALIRDKPGDPAALAKADMIIRANIERYASWRIDTVRKGSNDVIPFLVMGATMARLQGNLLEASLALAQVRDHDFVRRQECTFLSSAEIELEALRQAVVAPSSKEEILQSGRALYNRLVTAHHLAMADEAFIVFAEAMDPKIAEARLRPLRNTLHILGRSLRCSDIDLLLSGESAVRRVGV